MSLLALSDEDDVLCVMHLELGDRSAAVMIFHTTNALELALVVCEEQNLIQYVGAVNRLAEMIHHCMKDAHTILQTTTVDKEESIVLNVSIARWLRAVKAEAAEVDKLRKKKRKKKYKKKKKTSKEKKKEHFTESIVINDDTDSPATGMDLVTADEETSDQSQVETKSWALSKSPSSRLNRQSVLFNYIDMPEGVTAHHAKSTAKEKETMESSINGILAAKEQRDLKQKLRREASRMKRLEIKKLKKMNGENVSAVRASVCPVMPVGHEAYSTEGMTPSEARSACLAAQHAALASEQNTTTEKPASTDEMDMLSNKESMTPEERSEEMRNRQVELVALRNAARADAAHRKIEQARRREQRKLLHDQRREEQKQRKEEEVARRLEELKAKEDEESQERERIRREEEEASSAADILRLEEAKKEEQMRAAAELERVKQEQNALRLAEVACMQKQLELAEQRANDRLAELERVQKEKEVAQNEVVERLRKEKEALEAAEQERIQKEKEASQRALAESQRQEEEARNAAKAEHDRKEQELVQRAAEEKRRRKEHEDERIRKETEQAEMLAAAEALRVATEENDRREAAKAEMRRVSEEKKKEQKRQEDELIANHMENEKTKETDIEFTPRREKPSGRSQSARKKYVETKNDSTVKIKGKKYPATVQRADSRQKHSTAVDHVGKRLFPVTKGQTSLYNRAVESARRREEQRALAKQRVADAELASLRNPVITERGRRTPRAGQQWERVTDPYGRARRERVAELKARQDECEPTYSFSPQVNPKSRSMTTLGKKQNPRDVFQRLYTPPKMPPAKLITPSPSPPPSEVKKRQQQHESAHTAITGVYTLNLEDGEEVFYPFLTAETARTDATASPAVSSSKFMEKEEENMKQQLQPMKQIFEILCHETADYLDLSCVKRAELLSQAEQHIVLPFLCREVAKKGSGLHLTLDDFRKLYTRSMAFTGRQ